MKVGDLVRTSDSDGAIGIVLSLQVPRGHGRRLVPVYVDQRVKLYSKEELWVFYEIG